jgi:uncharacterized protein YecE (DUF72 family)
MNELPQAPPELQIEARKLAALAPRPALVDNVLLGTAGWTDPSLIKLSNFYPEGLKSPAQRLQFYSSQFSMVEVDATYYAIPDAKTSEKWLKSASSSLVFDIKAHPVFTGHALDRERLPSDIRNALSKVEPARRRLYPEQIPDEVRMELVRRFNFFLQPLQQANRIGCVMVQYPPWTTATRGAARALEKLADLLPGLRIAVEFRHPSWLEPHRLARVQALLRANDLAYVCVDEPKVQGAGVPPIVFSTREDLSLVRFHGHNLSGWRQGASVLERFNYLYSNDSLREWLNPIRELAAQSKEVHAVFNNCVRDYAMLNAKGLAALLLRDESELAVRSDPC